MKLLLALAALCIITSSELHSSTKKWEEKQLRKGLSLSDLNGNKATIWLKADLKQQKAKVERTRDYRKATEKKRKKETGRTSPTKK